MSLNFCDLLVLGSDLSGVMAATLLAKRGMNVLVLDDEDESLPATNLVTCLGSRGFKSLLGKLMIPDAKLQILHENPVGCQVVFPRHRIDLFRTRPLLFKEIEREFPQEKGLLEELFGEIDHCRENYLEEILSFFPIGDGKERKRFIRWFQSFPSEKILSLWDQCSPTLRCLLKVQLKFFSRGPLMDPPILQLLLFAPPEGDASFSIRGGVRQLKQLFLDKLDYFGGMVHPLGDEPFTLTSKGREIRAAQLSRYNFPTRCRYLLGNIDIQSLYRTLPSNFLTTLFGGKRKKVATLQPVEERRLVQYQLDREILPTPMKENVVVVNDPSAPLEGTNYLEINFAAIPKGGSNGSNTLMTVTYPLKGPLAAEIPESATLEKIHAEIDQKVHRLIPFSNSHLKRTFPPIPASSEAPELFPEENRLLEKSARRQISYAPSLFFPTLDSPFKNLFVVGPNILDWLGMEGKMLSSLRAVEMIWDREMKVRNP